MRFRVTNVPSPKELCAYLVSGEENGSGVVPLTLQVDFDTQAEGVDNSVFLFELGRVGGSRNQWRFRAFNYMPRRKEKPKYNVFTVEYDTATGEGSGRLIKGQSQFWE